MNNLYDYFKNIIDDNKLVQSFLIGNVTYEEIKDELIRVINEFIFKKNINPDENPDLYIVNNEKGTVLKEDVKDLISNISTTSQFNNVKVYIIDRCERLSDVAYNAILKTLEEPEEGIYAFLLTTNMDSVKPTIVSRCQKIYISSETSDIDFSDEEISIAESLIEHIEKDNIKTIGKYPNIYTNIADREKLQIILKYMLKYYMDELKNVINGKKTNSLITNKNIELLSKKIMVINDNINNLNAYLNKNLSIDRLIIEIWRCNNEDS